MSGPVDVHGILERAGADPDAPDGSQAWALAKVDAAVAELIDAVTDAAIRAGNHTNYRQRMDRLYVAVYMTNGDQPISGDLASRAPANLAEALARVGGAA